MTEKDQKREICPCQVCRSDLAYIVPCDFEDTIEFEVIYSDEQLEELERQIANE